MRLAPSLPSVQVAAGSSMHQVLLAKSPEVVRRNHEVEHGNQGCALAVKDLGRHRQQNPLCLHRCRQQIEKLLYINNAAKLRTVHRGLTERLTSCFQMSLGFVK